MTEDYEHLKEVNREDYFKRLSKEYGIEIPNLMALEQDYDLTPKGNDASAKKSSRRSSRSNLHQELIEPWQQWVYLRYLQNTIFYDDSGRMINPENRIFIRSIARDVEYRFGILNTAVVRKQIRKIRVVAGNDKRKARDAEIPLNVVAAQRKVELDGTD